MAITIFRDVKPGIIFSPIGSDLVCRKERHEGFTGELFIAVSILTGRIAPSVNGSTRIRTLPHDKLERLFRAHITKTSRRKWTRRQLAYVHHRITYPNKTMAQCARDAGYSEHMALDATRGIERRVKKIFSSVIWMRDEITEAAGLDAESKKNDIIRV